MSLLRSLSSTAAIGLGFLGQYSLAISSISQTFRFFDPSKKTLNIKGLASKHVFIFSASNGHYFTRRKNGEEVGLFRGEL
jgi:hypothetical protein